MLPLLGAERSQFYWMLGLVRDEEGWYGMRERSPLTLPPIKPQIGSIRAHDLTQCCCCVLTDKQCNGFFRWFLPAAAIDSGDCSGLHSTHLHYHFHHAAAYDRTLSSAQTRKLAKSLSSDWISVLPPMNLFLPIMRIGAAVQRCKKLEILEIYLCYFF